MPGMTAADPGPVHREQQVALLRTYLSLDHVPDVLIHGRAGTGKTLVARHVSSNTRCAYVSCTSGSTLKSLLATAVSKFNGDNAKRKRAQGYGLPGTSEASLMWELQELCPQDQPSRVLVLDNAAALLPNPLTSTPGSAGSGVLPALAALRGGVGANLALWLVSSQDPQCGLLPHLPPVLTVKFPVYTEEQLVDLLEQVAPQGVDGPLYRHFLGLTVPPAASLSRQFADLASIAATLWPSCAAARPPNRVGQPLTEAEQVRLRNQLQDKLSRALARFEPATCCMLANTHAAAATQQQQAGPGPAPGSGPSSSSTISSSWGPRPQALHQGLELPTLGKLLLLAAYLASRNTPGVDKQLWDSETAGANGRRRRGRRAQGSDRQTEAAREQLLKGPHSFPLKRLLHIYQQLARSEAPALALQHTPAAAAAAGGGDGASQMQIDQEQQMWPGQALGQAAGGGGHLHASSGGPQAALFGGGLLGGAGGAGHNSSGAVEEMGGAGLEVLQQLHGLISSRLLSQVRSAEVLEQPRYSCEAPGELVEHLAAELGVNLTQYLRYVA